MLKLLIAMLLCAVSAQAQAPASAAFDGVSIITVPTSNIQTPAHAAVVVPTYAYTDSTSRYPTVYLLNGYDGNHTDWARNFNLPALADDYGMILVCVDGRDSWYWNSTVNPKMQMESYIVDDLVPYIDATYPTLASADSRAITGLSMGGHGALWLAINHPDIWGNAASMSGGVDISKFPDRWKSKQALGAYADNPELWRKHTVMYAAENTLQPGQLNIYFDCGESDFFYKVNRALDAALTRRGIDHTFTHRPGSHSWKYWKESLPQHLDFFKSKFPKH